MEASDDGFDEVMRELDEIRNDVLDVEPKDLDAMKVRVDGQIARIRARVSELAVRDAWTRLQPEAKALIAKHMPELVPKGDGR